MRTQFLLLVVLCGPAAVFSWLLMEGVWSGWWGVEFLTKLGTD